MTHPSVLFLHTLYCNILGFFMETHLGVITSDQLFAGNCNHATLISKCTLKASCSFFCLDVKCQEAELIEGEIWEAHIFYIHRRSAFSFLLPHHVTVLIKNMLTHRPARISPPLFFLYLSRLSPLSLDHCLPRSHYSTSPRLLPPSGGLAVLT